MEFGPAAGSAANASWMLAKAPGVAPEQSTTALSANARLERRSTKQPKNNLVPEKQNLIVRYPHAFDLDLKIGTEL
jgi:hypothetical protein